MTMTNFSLATPLPDGRAKRLKALTSGTHDGVDRAIMSADSFADLHRYARFLAVQYMFHRDIAALYDDAGLRALFPDLAGRQRLQLVKADLGDLGLDAPHSDAEPRFQARTIDLAEALGWLYVAEGSNMGAAILRKLAGKIGLSDMHGARHLAPAPEGPAAHWRRFTAALDAVALSSQEEARAGAGANAAFARVQSLIDAYTI